MDILQSLITKPELRGDEVFRERLLDKLNQGYPDQVLYVSAGPGFGKSVLVNQWVEHEKVRHVWISCDQILNNPGVLAYYVLHALDKVSRKNFSELAEIFNRNFDENPENYLSSFMRALEEIEEPTTLVFDDFHRLTDPLILDLFTRITSNTPKKLSLCLITRKDHLPNLDKLRFKKLLCEVRGTTLNLNSTELLNTSIIQRVKLSRKDIQSILKLTEGWVLGVSQCLYLLKNNNLKLQEASEIKLSALDSVFLEEVLNNSSQELQNALKFANLYDRFSESMLRAVIPDSEGIISKNTQSYIQQFKANNLFLIQLDAEGTWYRFHHLFQRTLNNFYRSTLDENERISSLERGSEWLIKNGYFEDGIAIALQTNSSAFAVDQLMKVKYKLLNTDQYLRLQSLLSLYPLTLQTNVPELLITKAILLENDAKHEALFQLLNQFEEKGYHTSATDQAKAEFLILCGMKCYFTAEFDIGLRLLNEGISLNKPWAESILTFANAYKVFILNALDRYKEATALLDRHLDSLLPNQAQSIVRTYDAMALLFSIRSDLFNLEPIAKKILEISNEHHFYESQGFAYYFLADIYYRQYRFENLPVLFQKAYEKRRLMRPVWFLKLWAIKAFYCLRIGAQRDLKKTIEELKSYVDESNASNLQNLSKALYLEIEQQKGKNAGVKSMSYDIDFYAYPPMFYYFLPQNTHLKLLLDSKDELSQKHFEEKLTQLENYATKINHLGALTRINILRALSCHRNKQPKLAQEHIMNAFSYSEPINDLMIYSEYGHELYALICNLKDTGKKDGFASRVVKTLANIYPMNKGLKSRGLQELKIKERDIEILRLVSEGYSNEDIAEKMCLSLNSVKKYLSNLYRELDVNNRTGALLKAKETGIL